METTVHQYKQLKIGSALRHQLHNDSIITLPLLKLGHFCSTNENSVKTREHSPKIARLVDSALVERVIDENFMWNKYNSSTQNHSIDQISSFDELDYNFANATQRASIGDKFNQSYQSKKNVINNFNATFKKKISLMQLLDDDNANTSEKISPEANEKLFSIKTFSNAQLITFTEKSVGIISERNRDLKQQVVKYLNPSHINHKVTNSAILIEEDEEAENGNSNKSSSINKASSSDHSMTSSNDH